MESRFSCVFPKESIQRQHKIHNLLREVKECCLRCSSADPPQLSGTVDMVVEEDAELLLNCDIWANPRVSNVFWTQNGSAVDLEESGLTVSTDGSDSRLYAPKAQRGRHEGTYQCSVTYFSDVHTKVFNVTLTGQFTASASLPRVEWFFLKPCKRFFCRSAFDSLILTFRISR